jgi:predicted MFS family arabinose efflux permease
VFFFLPLYLEEILGCSPTQAGLLLLLPPLTVVMVIVSPLGGRIASRIGPRPSSSGSRP